MIKNTCPICSMSTYVKKKYQLKYVVYQCKKCKLEFCPDAAFNASFNSSLDENEREKALRQLRKENFDKILKSVKGIGSTGTGLEIGCGYGWFLESCMHHNVPCEGIEPETRFNDFYRL